LAILAKPNGNLGTWLTSGTGSFSNSKDSSTVYDPKGQEGIVKLIFRSDSGYCASVENSTLITLGAKPTISAGSDTTVCADVVLIPLKGTSNNVVTAVKWSVANGNSNFSSSSTALKSSYTPNQSERNAGIIVFQLQSTGQGSCKPVSAAKVVTVQKFPQMAANAGLPQSVCHGQELVTLSSKLINVQSASWASLTFPATNRGVFVDPKVRITGDTTFARNEYQASSIEKGNGKDTTRVKLRLTATSSLGKCQKTLTSDVELIIIPQPQITMFNKDSISACADKDTVNVKAEARIGGVLAAGFWTSTGTGVFEPNNLVRSASYRLSNEDRKKPSIMLEYHAFGNSGCDTVKSVKILNLVPAVPTVDAGPDQEVCKNNLMVPLQGAVTVATLYGWHPIPVGGKFLPDSNTLQTVFFPANAMANAKAMKLRLRSHGPSSCKDVTDDMVLTFSDIPKIEIKPDSIEICADTDTLQLFATVEVASGGLWTSSGTGRFLPSANVLNAQYLPSELDKTQGKVKLKVTSTGNDNCLAVTDSVLLIIKPRPTVTDTALSACANADSMVIKAASSTGAGFWATSGTGSFSPNENAMNAHYFPSFEDKKLGNWTLTFTSANNKTCQPVSRPLVINLQPIPVANAGQDPTICINTATLLSAETSPDIAQYSWKRLPNGTPTQDVEVNTGNLASTASFQLEVMDNNGCKNKDTVQVKVIPKPVVKIQNTLTCAYQDSVLKANVTNANPATGVFQWYENSVPVSGQTFSTTSVEFAGKYKVVFAIGQCQAEDSIKLNPLPTLEALNKFVCVNSDALLKVASNSSINYTWRKGTPNSTPVANTTAPQLSVTKVQDTATYYITARDANACLNTDSLFVFTLQPLKFQLKDSVLCAGTSLVLNAKPKNISAAANRFSYLWTPGGDQTAEKDVTKPSTIATVDTATYFVLVQVGNDSSSCSGIARAKVTYRPIPQLNLPDSKLFCGDEATSIIDAGVVANKYEWNTGETSRSIRVRQNGWYKVKVTNGFKCFATDSTFMMEKCQPKVHIPTAFSPNGDLNNDVFVVFGNKFVKNFRLIIFNRWGEIIYNVEDEDGTKVFDSVDGAYTWDGNYKGKPMPVGVYPFVVTYEGKEEEYKGPFKQEGSVMIIR
jgi:gliding motility-associated-like protein